MLNQSPNRPPCDQGKCRLRGTSVALSGSVDVMARNGARPRLRSILKQRSPCRSRTGYRRSGNRRRAKNDLIHIHLRRLADRKGDCPSHRQRRNRQCMLLPGRRRCGFIRDAARQISLSRPWRDDRAADVVGRRFLPQPFGDGPHGKLGRGVHGHGGTDPQSCGPREVRSSSEKQPELELFPRGISRFAARQIGNKHYKTGRGGRLAQERVGLPDTGGSAANVIKGSGRTAVWRLNR
jgi:hypothetical protein